MASRCSGPSATRRGARSSSGDRCVRSPPAKRAGEGREGPLVLAELGPNEIVGEVGILDGGARTATVTALAPTRTLELHRTVIAVVLIQYPAVAADLLRTLSRRLRSADELAEHLSRERPG